MTVGAGPNNSLIESSKKFKHLPDIPRGGIATDFCCSPLEQIVGRDVHAFRAGAGNIEGTL